MPAAIQHLSRTTSRRLRNKKLAEIQEMHDNPPDMSPGQAYFTNQMRAEKERKAAEIQAMKENPPAPSVAGQHFEKMNEQRAREIEEMMNEPAPMAIEYFTQKGIEEKSKRDLALKASNETPVVASLATQHFDMMKEKKAQEIEEAREQTRQKMQEKEARPTVDWAALTKQQAPSVPKYYTASQAPIAA